MVAGFGFVGAAMAPEIGDDYMVVLGEGRDVALEDGSRACEAVELVDVVRWMGGVEVGYLLESEGGFCWIRVFRRQV